MTKRVNAKYPRVAMASVIGVVLALAALAVNTAAAVEPPVTLYYLHGMQRCRTCLSIEAQARGTVESAFATNLKAGELGFQSVNFEQRGNEHFVREFSLVSSSLVLIERKSGKTVRSKLLAEAWLYANDESRFRSWLLKEIAGFLKGQG